MDIEYVSMHCIQRRMQAEGLGQEAVVEHLHPLKRDAKLNQMRATWEPIIRRELAEAKRLNPAQQFALSTKFRQKHGHLVSLWLTPNWLCYTLSEKGEVLTVGGINNAMADILDALDRPKKTKPRCAYKTCPDPAKNGSRFCKKHAGVGPEHEQRIEKQLAKATTQLLQARTILNALMAKMELRKKRIETQTPLGRCAHEGCNKKIAGHTFYCNRHVTTAQEEELLMSLEKSTAESTLDWAEKNLAAIKDEAQNTFRQPDANTPEERVPARRICCTCGAEALAGICYCDKHIPMPIRLD